MGNTDEANNTTEAKWIIYSEEKESSGTKNL
jgi:hypothetical protein